MDSYDRYLYFSDMNTNAILQVRPNSAGITACALDWSWDTANHPPDDYDLWTVIQGKGEMVSGDTDFPLGPGDCFLLRPQGRYIATHDSDNPLTVIHVHFDFHQPSENKRFPFHRKLSSLGFIRDLLTRSVLSFQERNRNESAFWLTAALREIQQQDQRSQSVAHLQGRMEKIEQICQNIRNNPEANHRLTDLAGSVGVSTDHFTRLFKQTKDLTPRDFILRTRIESAQSLLQVSSYSVTRIAELLGYTDVYYFSKQFTAKVGVSPTAYRRQEISRGD